MWQYPQDTVVLEHYKGEGVSAEKLNDTKHGFFF
jgi:hypothetical protein